MNILQELYDSQINFSISAFYDGGFEFKIGDKINGFDDESVYYDVNEGFNWLEKRVVELFPYSLFAKARKQ